MTCPVCGTPTVPGARFCYSCGSALPGEALTAEVETDRRVVTVLFGDLSDFTSWAEDLDPERVGSVTDRVLATLAGIVTEHGGHVDKLVGDGIMAVFGAPTAHEDDPERAVRSAFKMQAAVRRLVAEESGGGRQLGLRVGLNTGEVVAGVQAHLSYTVVGDTVNTASRLADAAGVGAVVAGRDTALVTMPIASWRALRPLRLKGKREPVEAFELLGLRPAGASRLGLGDDAPFLGRDAELGLLVGRFFETIDAQEPHSMLVTGEAGVGKTRLAQEMTRRVVEVPGVRVLWGRCAPYGEGRDLAAVSEMVRTACGIEPTDPPDTARARLARTVSRLEQLPAARLPAQTAERLGQLLGLEDLEPAAPRETAAPGPASGGVAVREAVAALFTALAAEGPLLLVMDDLHWATPLLIDGLLHVAERTRGPVLLLALGRMDVLDVSGRPQWWEQTGAELLPLTPLEPTASDRLLRAYLGSSDVDDAVRTALLDRAQGNPFFLGELLHLLIDRGALRRVGTRWVLEGEVPGDVLPAGVQAVLAARIDDLDGAAKGVLRDASVIGLSLSFEALEAVGRASGHGDPVVVRTAVAGLVDRRLLEPDGEGYRFAHTLVRDVAYAGLAKVERARRHAAAAQWALAASGREAEAELLTATQGERAVQLAAEMGLPAHDPAWSARPTAFDALVRLGTAALGRDDALAAEALLARALTLARPPQSEDFAVELLTPVRLARAQALSVLHRLDEAEAELRDALAVPEHTAQAQLVLGSVRRRRGDLAGARESFVGALTAASDRGDDRQAAEALRALGLLDYFEGRLSEAERHVEQARSLAAQVGDARGVAWALQHLAWSATTRGDYQLALDALHQAEELFGAAEDPAGLSWVGGTEGFVRLLQGRFTEARELAALVLPLGEQKGERWGVAALLTIDAMAAAQLGEVVVGAAEAERARVRFADVGDAWGEALALVAAGVSARGAGMPERSVAFLQQAVELSERGRHPLTAALALVSLGYAHLDRGDPDAAQACVERLGGALAGIELQPQAMLGARVLMAEVLRRKGRAQEALAEVDAALSAAGDGPGLLFSRRQALAHRADALADLGRADEAVQTAQRAVDTPAEDVRSEVLALRALGCALRASGDEEQARKALERALETARLTGQVTEVAVTQQLLSAGGGP
ncbi:MAG TPA: adenylate/guanylate cyclase domain-containing protein [Mycobacteriales bacterium]|nr:adenylate/guanylate cyclase domain-containing protein [Mycobacteriales bacterium]